MIPQWRIQAQVFFSVLDPNSNSTLIAAFASCLQSRALHCGHAWELVPSPTGAHSHGRCRVPFQRVFFLGGLHIFDTELPSLDEGSWRSEWEDFLGQLRGNASSWFLFHCCCANEIPAVHLSPGWLYPTPVPAATVLLNVSGLQAVSCLLQQVSSFPKAVPSDQGPLVHCR